MNKNIAKFLGFVTAFCGICLILTNCNFVFSNTSKKSSDKTEYDFADSFLPPKVIGTLKSDEIPESSGLVVSRCNQNVLWTHNDSGDKAFIYAINFKGDKLATYTIPGAKNIDWEDIATLKKSNGECLLYVGDTGNNSMEKSIFTIYVVKEPTVSQPTDSSRANPLETALPQLIKYKYPDSQRNSETLLVHPVSGDIYALSKQPSTPSIIYKLSMAGGIDSVKDNVNIMEKLGEYGVPAVPNGYLTGGEISPDGKRIILCDYLAAYEITLPANEKNFDAIWKQRPAKIDLGSRQQGEAICYGLDGNSIYATSEKKNSSLIEVKRK